MKKTNAFLNANYFEQVIDEACNADYGFNNHMRRVMTIGECCEAYYHSKVWLQYAKTV